MLLTLKYRKEGSAYQLPGMQQVRRLHLSHGLARKWIRIHWWPAFRRWQELEAKTRVYLEEETKIRNIYRVTDDYYISPEKREDGECAHGQSPTSPFSVSVVPKKADEDKCRRDWGAMPLEHMTNHTMFRYVDHSIDNIKRVKRYEALQLRQYDQR